MDGALGSTSGGFFLGSELSLVDLLFCSFLERAEASLLYYKGFRVRDAAKYPNICAWFDAMESRPSFRASQSDYYTHAMDLPPQLGGCSAESGGEAQRALLDLSLIHISEPTRHAQISYAVFCLKKKK